MDILAQFMGHDIRVHRNFYRLPQDTLQMATVSKLLLALEEGNVGNFRGKSLEEIELNMDVVEEDEDVYSESDHHHEDDSDESAVVEGDEDGDEDMDSEREGFDPHEHGPDVCPVQQRAEKLPKRRSRRVPWTDSEKRAVKAELGQFISKLKVPGKLDCDTCLKKRKELSRRTWKDIKNFVHNTIQTVKRKYNFKN